MTIQEITDKYKEGKKVEEVINDIISSAKIIDERVHALLGFYSDNYIKSRIAYAQSLLDNNKSTVLTGVPIVVKDNIMIEGETSTSGSQMLRDYTATYTATVIKLLEEAGAIPIARANMDEFAMGGSTENSSFFKTLNPLDTELVPGGSSGGSAAAVSANMVPIALGSDTGGSIRQPASFTGIVGLKPTYGQVSRYGIMAMGSSLDQIGVFANNIKDANDFYNFINAYDKHDATSLSIDDRVHIKAPVKPKIGIPRAFLNMPGISAEVLKNFNETENKLKALDYEIIDIDMPSLPLALSIYYILMFAEVSSNMGRYDGIRYGHHHESGNMINDVIMSRTEGLGREVKRRILLGTYVLSAGYYDAYYNKALIARENLRAEFKRVLAQVDVIMTPTSPVLPWKFGEKEDPLTMYLADIFTVPANIVGVPGLSVPSGKANDNLKYGVQLMGDVNSENILFTVGKDIESI